MKDALGGKIMAEFALLRPKTYSCLMDDGSNDKKAKGIKKCVIKRILKFNDNKNYLNVKHIKYTLKKLTRLH